jgi:hypothetical protein
MQRSTTPPDAIGIGDRVTARFRDKIVTGIVHGRSISAEPRVLEVVNITTDQPVTSVTGREVSKIYLSGPAIDDIRVIYRAADLPK